MARPTPQLPNLPEYLTWEELENLPEEVAAQIELWEGRVVWVRRGPAEHQIFTMRLTVALEMSARKAMSERPEYCWRPGLETNVFLRHNDKNDFLTPDFLVYRCLDSPYQSVHAEHVVLVGEVLSPSNTHDDVEAKKARYAGAGIRWYWEVVLAREASAIATVRAYALGSGAGRLPEGVHPLRPVSYVLAGEWTRNDPDGIAIEFPFPIHIPWSDLEF